MSSNEDRIDFDVSSSEFEVVIVSVVWMTSVMTSGVVLISFTIVTTLVNEVSSVMTFCVVVSMPPLHTFMESEHVAQGSAVASMMLYSVKEHFPSDDSYPKPTQF